MILVDSSVWIDFFNGRPSNAADKLDELLGREMLATGDLMLAEVLQGFSTERDFRTARKILTSLPIVNIVDRAIALQAAVNYRRLRRRGITVRKLPDMLIATCCIERQLSLLHADRDFDPCERHLGLRVVRTAGTA